MKRDIYLEQLKRKMHNGLIKIVTGIRRCGKSYLLFNLFYDYLKSMGIDDNHIVKIAFDDRRFKEYRNPDRLCEYIYSKIKDDSYYYILLDEVQLVSEFEDVLNSLLHNKNIDTYVTGSNAKFLSKDIITEFRGRGDQIHIFPLSFSEFMQSRKDNPRDAWMEYITYGGMPKLLEINNEIDKAKYLESIFSETYIVDIIERNKIRNKSEIEELLNYLASSIGGLTNPKKLSDTYKSVKNVNMHPDTIKNYLEYFEDAFLVSKSIRYNIKGKKYINTPMKYYFTDVGLRNARIGFRQIEENHLMENIIYNELLVRGYNVDVGVVEHIVHIDKTKKEYSQLEVDFVCNLGSKRIYIQSALEIPTKEKQDQEEKSLVNINDSFKKVIVIKNGLTHYDENGILMLNLFDFLLNKSSLDS